MYQRKRNVRKLASLQECKAISILSSNKRIVLFCGNCNNKLDIITFKEKHIECWRCGCSNKIKNKELMKQYYFYAPIIYDNI